MTCRGLPQHSTIRARCNYVLPNQGCVTCKLFGVLCVVEGVILPPHPQHYFTGRNKRLTRCGRCVQNGSRCERQRPCQYCYDLGHANDCRGSNGEGTFRRGMGVGVECYPYLSEVGGGLMGVNDPNPFGTRYFMPDDFHLQYNSWLAGGPLPVPPGFPQPVPLPPRPHGGPYQLPAVPGTGRAATVQVPPAPAPALGPANPAVAPSSAPAPTPIPAPPPPSPQTLAAFQPPAAQVQIPDLALTLDILNFGEQPNVGDDSTLVEAYRQVWNTIRELVQGGSEIDLTGIRDGLRGEMMQRLPVDQSIFAIMISEYQRSQVNSTFTVPPGRPITIPPGVDQAEVESLGLGATAVFNVGEQLQSPPSPGPAVGFFVPNEEIDIVGNLLAFDVGHPERANPGYLVPAFLHPNGAGIPSLRTVPMENLTEELEALDDVFRLASDCVCLEPKGGGVLCLKPTNRYCVDISHNVQAHVGVCDECNEASRARFEKRLAEIIFDLRAYSCSNCAARATDFSVFQGKRLRVWGFPVTDPTANPAADPAASVPNASTNRGGLLRLTGCSCATKLLDRRLCTSHRLEHFLEVREKARSMKNYIQSKWARSVCAFCLEWVGTDSYQFRGNEGREGQSKLYTCLSCLGVVIADDNTHHTIIQDAAALQLDNPYPAFLL
ncbi:hypothetical protein HD806DRAFT_511599 [Xylariaceae sp. AK1471]|nr:hypothetical protein HD806DRAFT_511599 [Xylariaceae sp. AK1471]